MEKGYWQKCVRAKEGAYETIDNITKFALNDDDYEYVEEWIEYTDEEYTELRVGELKKNLSDTDYIFAKTLESMVECSTVEELFSVMSSFDTEYKDKISDRKKWREEINALESEIKE